MSIRAMSLLFIQVQCLWSLSAMSVWADWWQTPEQKAIEALKNGDSETLLKVAPSDDWRGVGEFEAGDFGAAAKTFGNTAIDHALNGDQQAENDALYNQGVSQVRNRQYQEAINNFNTVIDRDPDYVDAEHNRAIAEKLLQLQQQQQQQQQSGSDDNEDPSQNQQQSSEEGEQQQDESGSQSESSESQDSQSRDEQSSSSSDQDEESESAENGDEQDQLDAEQALEAEARSDEDSAQQGEQDIETDMIESPMSEADQAAEQLLRRIPDDPAGLLRRKLEQSHRSEYPEVGDARQPW